MNLKLAFTGHMNWKSALFWKQGHRVHNFYDCPINICSGNKPFGWCAFSGSQCQHHCSSSRFGSASVLLTLLRANGSRRIILIRITSVCAVGLSHAVRSCPITVTNCLINKHGQRILSALGQRYCIVDQLLTNANFSPTDCHWHFVNSIVKINVLFTTRPCQIHT